MARQYLFICQNLRSTIFQVSLTVQQAGQTGGCTAFMSALYHNRPFSQQSEGTRKTEVQWVVFPG